MSDVRALLKAKRQETRITHLYATYTATGQLKCSVCASLVKHASAWEGHLGSKLHRTNVANLREGQRQQQTVTSQNLSSHPGKRKKDDGVGGDTKESKQRKLETPTQFPQDFFSDPSRVPIFDYGNNSDDQEDNAPMSSTHPGPVSIGPTSNIDMEYESFRRGLLISDPPNTLDDHSYATIVAKPVPAVNEPSGFPISHTEAGFAVTETQLSEEEIKLNRDQQERELIMDRLLAEERAQEDADMRVQFLKNKLESVRKKRDMAKTQKTIVTD